MNRKEKIHRECRKRWLESHPWSVSFYGAKHRCESPKHVSYHKYGGKGIKFLMTMDDFKYLWFRDKAYLMKKPTIDRLNSNGDYCLDNCRYLDFLDHAALTWHNKSHSKKVLCKETGEIYPSVKKAAEALKMSRFVIYKLLWGKRQEESPFNFQYV